MKTYWQAKITGNQSIHSCLTSGETIEKTIESAITDAVYRQAMYPTERITINIEEFCSTCGAMGTIIKHERRPFKTVRCPACKGKVPTGKIGPIVFTMPDPANRISLVQAA